MPWLCGDRLVDRFEQANSTDLQHLGLRVDGLAQSCGQGERYEVAIAEFETRQKLIWPRQFMPGVLATDKVRAELGVILTERREQPDMPPAAEMFRNVAAIVDLEGQTELMRVDPRLDPDRTASYYGDSWQCCPGHSVLPSFFTVYSRWISFSEFHPVFWKKQV